MDQSVTPQDQEMLRRRAGLGGSSAGIPGGAQTTTNPLPSSPLAQAGVTPQQPVSGGGDFGTVKGQTAALAQAYPQEANIILKSLTKTLDRMTKPQGA